MEKKAFILVFVIFVISLLVLTGCATNTENLNKTIPCKLTECSSDSDCIKSGCSGQLCILKPSSTGEGDLTTCEFKPEYACYSQVNCVCAYGKCSWSDENKLANCIKEKSQK